ncbi:hypothetical protein PENTCL1PPCAC_7730, partial [Pristionchus entomophagus]
RSVWSSSLGYGGGGYIAVSSFRGGGYSHGPNSQTQTITSSIIHASLFNNSQSSYYETSGKKIRVTQPESPVTIKDDLIYFWGQTYLPDPKLTGCVQFITSNVQYNVSFCNINELTRCSRQIANASDLSSYSFYVPKFHTPLTSFAWLCPKTHVCCEWECCEPTRHEESNWFFYFFIGLLFVVGIATVMILSENPFKAHTQYVNANKRKPVATTDL